MVACSEFNTTYNKSALPFAQSCFWGKTGGEKGYGRRERKEREAGVFRGREAGDHVELKKNTINNFNIIMLLICIYLQNTQMSWQKPARL